MKKDGLLGSILGVVLLSIIVIGIIMFFIYQKKLIGFIFVLVGFLHLLVLRLFGVDLRTIWPDLIFGGIDNGFLVLAAVIGADFAGVLGAIVGGAAGNAITDGLAGIFEGWTAEYMRKKKVRERRTILGTALGKMAGCFFGAGLMLILFWSIV